MSAYPATLSKEERICSKKLIETLFQGGQSHAMSAYPLRVVYMSPDGGNEEHIHGTMPPKPNAQFLISVPKRCFKRAVKRNLVKRQVREAYRKHKWLIADKPVAMAFVWLDARLHPSKEVEAKVVNLLKRIDEKLTARMARPVTPSE